jgi:hypothetical protein
MDSIDICPIYRRRRNCNIIKIKFKDAGGLKREFYDMVGDTMK